MESSCELACCVNQHSESHKLPEPEHQPQHREATGEIPTLCIKLIQALFLHLFCKRQYLNGYIIINMCAWVSVPARSCLYVWERERELSGSLFISCLFGVLLLFSTVLSFSHQRWLMVFHWSLSDSKFPQVSRTILSILAVLNNAVIWMVSTRPSTSQIIIIIIIYPFRVFHISVSWWFFAGVWVTASLLKSPGLFSVV